MIPWCKKWKRRIMGKDASTASTKDRKALTILNLNAIQKSGKRPKRKR